MANLYDLKKFDLNLLVIFECIYQHLSISKAAETLYITPSAVSQSLQRLRTQLNDPLFIRSGKGITPTTLGINLHHHLEKNLNSLEQTINIMNETEISKKFIIYGPQIIISKNIISMVNHVRQNRNIEIEHHDILTSKESAEDLLAYRKADLVISPYSVNNLSIICKPAKPVESVLIFAKDHPRINENSSLEEIIEEQFTFLMHEDPGIKAYQLHPDNIIRGRRIGFRSHSLIAIANVIATTDIIGFVPKVVYDFYQPLLGFKRVNCPLSTPLLHLYYMYNRASLNNTLFSEIISHLESE